MFMAMNRFRVSAGREADFERTWRERKSYLGGDLFSSPSSETKGRANTLVTLPGEIATPSSNGLAVTHLPPAIGRDR